MAFVDACHPASVDPQHPNRNILQLQRNVCQSCLIQMTPPKIRKSEIFKYGLNFVFHIKINLPVALEGTGYSLVGWQSLHSRETERICGELETLLKVLFTVVEIVIQE